MFLYYLTVEKYSFDPTGSGLIVGAFGVQFAGHTAQNTNVIRDVNIQLRSYATDMSAYCK